MTIDKALTAVFMRVLASARSGARVCHQRDLADINQNQLLQHRRHHLRHRKHRQHLLLSKASDKCPLLILRWLGQVVAELSEAPAKLHVSHALGHLRSIRTLYLFSSAEIVYLCLMEDNEGIVSTGTRTVAAM